MKECLLCSFNSNKQFIDETSGWYIDIPRDFEFKGLYFIRCKRHIESLGEMNIDESNEIGGLIQKYSEKSKNEAKALRVLALSLGLSDPHIHFWILPKTDINSDQIEQIRLAMKNLLSKYKT